MFILVNMSANQKLRLSGKTKLGVFLYEYRALMIMLLAVSPTVLNLFFLSKNTNWKSWWPILNYFIGYETGFGGRKLIGTLFKPFLPEFVTASHIQLIVITANLFLIFSLIWLYWRTLSSDGNKALPMAGLLTLYALSPFSVFEFVSSSLSLAFMETYQLLLVILWLLLFINRRNTWYYYLLTFVVTVACCLIHHTFCCTLFPLMFALFVYDTLRDKEVSKTKVACYGLNLLSLFVLFIALWKYSSMTIDIDSLYERIVARTDACTDEKEVLDLLYYMSSGKNFLRSLHYLKTIKVFEFVFSFVMMSPIIGVFCCPWIMAARNAETKRSKLCYLMPVASVLLLTVPVFFIATDYSRWWVCWELSFISLLLAAYASHDELVLDSLSRMFVFAKRHWYLALSLVVYVIQFHIDGFEGLKESSEFYSLVRNWLPWQD